MTVIFKAGLNGDVLWDSSKPSVTERILNPKCKVEVNKAASASFVIFPTHPLYGSLEKMKTLVTIEIDGRLVFRGRVIDIQTDIYKQKSVTCEGDYAFLLDTVHPPIKGSYSPTQLLTNLIRNHNEKVEDWKKFTVGTVSITEATTAKQIDASGYAKTSDVINSELLQEYGGIIRTRFEDGVAYIDYIEDPFTQPIETINAQQIKYGVNLVDFNEQYPINDLFTVLLPTGKDDMTIASVNDGSPYLISQEAVDAFGWICHTESWSHIDNATELKNTAQTYLNGHARKFPNDLTVRAVDLKMLSDGYEEFKMGDMVRVSIPHLQEDEILYCLSIDYDFQNPGSTSYRLGTFVPSDKQKGSTQEQSGGGGCSSGGSTASEQAAKTSSGGRRSAAGAAAGLAAAEGEIEEIKEWRSEFTDEEKGYKSVINQTADKIYSAVENTKKELTASISVTDGKIESEVTSRNEALEGLKSSIEQSLGSITATVKDNSEHISTISAKLNSITLSVSNGDTESRITLKAGETTISSEKISFKGYATFEALEALSGKFDRLVSGTTAADKLAATSITTGSLSVTGRSAVSFAGGLNVGGGLIIGEHSVVLRTLSLGAVSVQNGVYGTNSSAINLDHSHSFDFTIDTDGNVTGTVGSTTKANGTDSFNIASTTFHRTKVAEAEQRGASQAKSNVSLYAGGWSYTYDYSIGAYSASNTVRDRWSGENETVYLPTISLNDTGSWSGNYLRAYAQIGSYRVSDFYRINAPKDSSPSWSITGNWIGSSQVTVIAKCTAMGHTYTTSQTLSR